MRDQLGEVQQFCFRGGSAAELSISEGCSGLWCPGLVGSGAVGSAVRCSVTKAVAVLLMPFCSTEAVMAEAFSLKPGSSLPVHLLWQWSQGLMRRYLRSGHRTNV